MLYDFPIQNIDISYTKDAIAKLNDPRLVLPGLQVAEKEFFIEVGNVAQYLVKDGKEVVVKLLDGADPASVNLFLSGSVFGAILHQQGLLPIHGSSFSYHGKGILICGQSGAGKSSVVAAFCQKEGQFINDDITPIVITNQQTNIVPIKTRIKLWDDSLDELNLRNDHLVRIRPSIEKFYLPNNSTPVPEQKLDHLFILSPDNKDVFSVHELAGLEKYNALRNQIYRKVYLKGMPVTSKAYFKQLFLLSSQISVKLICRPSKCDIRETMAFIKNVIDK